jgi:putative membrane protein
MDPSDDCSRNAPVDAAAVDPFGEGPPEDLRPEVPREAARPLRGVIALAGTVATGVAMGVAEVVPGFSGGTVALVAGIYERLIAAIRQGARVVSLLLRGRAHDAWCALTLLDWPFVIALFGGMVVTVFTVASPLRRLLDARPVEMSSVFLGLVLGAAIVAARQLRRPAAVHLVIGAASAALAFAGLGLSPGTLVDPSPLVVLLGGAVAVSAWILPGVSGSFLLLVIGLYTAVVGAVADRDLLVLAIFGLGCGIGLAVFSTLLNWLLARYHDLVLAVLLGLMVGSVRILWPWPSATGVGNPRLGAPEADTALLALALALAAFALVLLFGLTATAIEERRTRSPAGPQSPER